MLCSVIDGSIYFTKYVQPQPGFLHMHHVYVILLYLDLVYSFGNILPLCGWSFARFCYIFNYPNPTQPFLKLSHQNIPLSNSYLFFLLYRLL